MRSSFIQAEEGIRITTMHAYGDAGYLIQGKKNKIKKRCGTAKNVGIKDHGLPVKRVRCRGRK